MTRPFIFLFPEINMQSGGNIAQMNLFKACSSLRDSEIVTYRVRVNGFRYLEDLMLIPSALSPIFLIHYGEHVEDLVKILTGCDVIYVAHSAGWGFRLSSKIPILAVSRHTLAYWGRHAPNSLIFYVPNILNVEPEISELPPARDIDVLVQKRKSSAYLLTKLVPALERAGCTVFIQDGWVDDLYGLMRRSKVYLYDSVEHWINKNATEGFGLQPIEALACGCTVFSSVNDALADYLDPGVNSFKIRVYSTDYDCDRILKSVRNYKNNPIKKDFFLQFEENIVKDRLHYSLSEIEDFFHYQKQGSSDIPDAWIGNRFNICIRFLYFILRRIKKRMKFL